MPNLMDALSENDAKRPGLQKAMGGGATPNGELMRQAREALEGNWAMAVVGNILYQLLVMSVVSFVIAMAMFAAGYSAVSNENPALIASVVSQIGLIIQGLLQGALLVGFCSFFLVIVQDNETRLECLFTGFKRFWTALGAYFVSTLFIMLWSLLFLIPGIIAVFRYAMVYFILADDPSAGPIEAIRRSKEMMKGNKWKFFCLQWRFFGWALLCLFTCGVGHLWLIPYMQTTMAQFYEDVK